MRTIKSIDKRKIMMFSSKVGRASEAVDKNRDEILHFTSIGPSQLSLIASCMEDLSSALDQVKVKMWEGKQ